MGRPPWHSIADLERRVDALPFKLDIGNGAFLGGGSIVRALVGAAPAPDLDIITPNDDVAMDAAELLAKGGWFHEPIDVGSDTEGRVGPDWAGHWAPPDAPSLTVDLIGAHFDLASWLGHVDLTCCQVAIAGEFLWMTRDAMWALMTRTFQTTRETRKERITRYMAIGLQPWGLSPENLERESVPCWWRADMTPEEALGHAPVPVPEWRILQVALDSIPDPDAPPLRLPEDELAW